MEETLGGRHDASRMTNLTEETREKRATAMLNEDSDEDINRAAILEEEQNTDRNS
jgi:hypothetical protein